MKAKVAHFEFTNTQVAPFQSAQWHPIQFFIIPIILLLLFMSLKQEVGIKRTPITELFRQTTEATGSIANTTSTQNEEERMPPKEISIRKISTDNTTVASTITINKAGQSLCSFVSLRDALRIAMKYKLKTYGEDSKVVVTSVAQGLAFAKREKVITIVTKGQEFLLK